MLKHQLLPVVALLVLGAIHTEAFSLSQPTLVRHFTSSTPSVRSITFLRAEESPESQEEGAAPATDEGDDDRIRHDSQPINALLAEVQAHVGRRDHLVGDSGGFWLVTSLSRSCSSAVKNQVM